MAIDNKYKRASVISLVVPLSHGALPDGTSSVSDSQRLAVTWMYNGIIVSSRPIYDFGDVAVTIALKESGSMDVSLNGDIAISVSYGTNQSVEVEI